MSRNENEIAARCRVTVLTPPGRGAIATVGVLGSQATTLVAGRFQAASGRSLTAYPLGRVLFGSWRHASTSMASEEVVVVQSAEDQVDVHCHGGDVAAGSIVQTLVDAGAEHCEVSDWLEQRVPDTIQRDALAALLGAETERAAAILLNQYRGALRTELQQVTNALQNQQIDESRHRLEQMQQAGLLGIKLTQPWRVVVAGPPNVGKSSLVNSILGYDRSIVHGQPGTTRDRVETRAVLSGWPFLLSDTAGLRDADEVTEAAGISRARESIQQADLVLWVRELTALDDSRQPPGELSDCRMILVASKSDLLAGPLPAGLGDWISTSSRNGDGIERLKSTIVERLVPISLSTTAAVPFTEAQRLAIDRALEALASQDGEAARLALEKLLQ